MRGERITALCSWGKHFLIRFPDFAMRVHFMLFGSYRINERREAAPRMSLRLCDGSELNFYACSLRYIEGDLDAVYDWSRRRDGRCLERLARASQAALPPGHAGRRRSAGPVDLFRRRQHHQERSPAPHPGASGKPGRRAVPAQTRRAGETGAGVQLRFLRWKKAYELRRHYQVHTRTICPRDGNRLSYRARLGRAQRRAFFCEHCQRLYRLDE